LIPLIAMLMGLPCRSAEAHDWFKDMKDPSTNLLCCGNDDCDRLDDRYIEEVEGGYHVVIPPGEAVSINKFRVKDPVDIFVPYDRVLGSQRNYFALCIPPDFYLDPRHPPPNLEEARQKHIRKFYCFFAPGMT